MPNGAPPRPPSPPKAVAPSAPAAAAPSVPLAPTAAAPSAPAAAAPPALPTATVPLPPDLRDFVVELEQWAAANAKDARRDALRFWSLKIPAVLSSASAGVLALWHLSGVAAALAAAASACVLIDAVNPGGQLRNAHLRAVHDLRDLEHHVVNEWRIGALKGKSGNHLAAEILESAQKARDKIAADLRVAETSFARTVSPK